MSIHEQARAEAEKRLPDRPETLARDMAHNVQAVRLRESFVAGAEWAATRTRVVTTEDIAAAIEQAIPAVKVPGFRFRYAMDAAERVMALYDPEEDR